MMMPAFQLEEVTKQAMHLPLLEKIKLIESLIKSLPLEISAMTSEHEQVPNEEVSVWGGLLSLAENAPKGKFVDPSIHHDQILYSKT
ncbi:MAG: hypothetical protein KIH69_007695 [Anaerolineae bacterium]|nr:hypothetical protein [Anaerolineae bacterium]